MPFKKLEDFEEIERCCNSLPEYYNQCKYLIEKNYKVQIHENYLLYVLGQKELSENSFATTYLIEYRKSLDPDIAKCRSLIERDLQRTILAKNQISLLRNYIDEQHKIQKRKMKEES